MNNLIIRLLTITLSLSFLYSPSFCKYNNDGWKYIDFDISMGKETKYYKMCIRNQNRYSLCIKPKPANILMDFFRKIHKTNNLTSKKSHKAIGIPNIIHQIWLGSKVPKRYEDLIESWKKYHPDWEYKLWTDKEVSNFDMVNRKIFNKVKDYAEKANILRYEILYQFGGLYVDTDFQCLKPFDVFNDNYDFYCGIAPLDCDVLCINNALIGSVPGHPILKHSIDNIKFHNNSRRGENRSGPVHLTKSFWYVVNNILSEEEISNIIALPTTYFYPLGLKDKNLESLEKFINKFPEAFGIHFWDATWTKKNKH